MPFFGLPASLRGGDRIITGGILLLIIFPPLAFGTVHPWAVSLMEVIIFLLMTIWMGKLLCSFPASFPCSRSFFSLFLFGCFILVQILPLPPSLLQVLSSSTYEIYSDNLPGWPERPPYHDVTSAGSGNGDESQSQVPLWRILPTAEEVQRGSSVPFSSLENHAPTSEAVEVYTATPDSRFSHWRPLSLAPRMTEVELLKFCAYVAVFLLIYGYQFSPTRQQASPWSTTIERESQSEEELERQFVRIVLLAVLVSGLLVATVGLLQQLTWNGKLLWFFVPYDWGAPRLEAFPRMSGPFVNPDHFANYLMLCFPLALVGTFSPHAFHLGQRPGSLQFFCGITACILFIGILFSRSRGGWLAMLFSVSVLLWEIRTLLRRKLFSWFGVGKIRAIILSMALLGGLWLFCLGTAGREQLVARVEETFKEDLSLRIRVTAWRGSLAIIQDFPVLGVGLGAWPELFPRYRPSPWLPLFYREAHNDYLELAAETGFLGCALLAWFFGQSARRLMKRLQSGVSSFSFSYLALLAACVGMAVHELVDANLQVPANALLFIVVFGLALRLTRARKREEMDLDPLSLGKQGWTLRPAAGVGMLSAVLLVITSTRESLSYSQNAPSPSSLTEARALILSHPTRSSAHLALARQLRERTSSARWLEELRIAVTLDQANPAIRDLYAWSLLQAGKENEGLEQISQAIFFSPKLSAHSYLATRMLPWLSAKEHAAVEAGFQQAVTLGIDEAALELGAFYHALNRFTEEGRLYEMMALRYSTPRAKAEAVLQAARAYALAGALEKAEELFRRGAELVPTDPGPYHYLALWIFAPRKDLRSAEQVITEGIRKGADPFSLSLSLAETAKKIGNLDAAEAAFLRALALRPSSYDARLKLGLLYLQQNLAERAALLLRQVTELNPHQAEPFYYLGLAEEARSEFSAAEQAYSRALTLAPGNIDFRNQYEALLKKISGHGMHAAIGEQLRRRMNQ